MGGRRSRLECNPEDKTEGRKKHTDPTQWYKGLNFVLPAEPARKDLILEGHTNMVDAVIFLNKEDSELPKAILEAGCCAVFAKKFKKWHVFFKYGLKDKAMELFGVQSTDSNEGDEEEKENQTPPQKKIALESGEGTKEEKEKEKEERKGRQRSQRMLPRMKSNKRKKARHHHRKKRRWSQTPQRKKAPAMSISKIRKEEHRC